MIFVVISVLCLSMIDYSCGFSCNNPEKHQYYAKNEENEIVEVDFEKNITIKGTFPFNRANAKFNYAEQLSPDKVLISYNVENERKLELVNPYGNGTEIKVDENISLEFGVSFPVDEKIFHCYKHRCFRLIGDEFSEVEEMKVPKPADSTEIPRYPFVVTYGKMVCLLGGGQTIQNHTETWCLDQSNKNWKWVANKTMPSIGGRKFYWAHAIHNDALVVCTLKTSPMCKEHPLGSKAVISDGDKNYNYPPETACKMGDMTTLKYCSTNTIVSVAGGIVDSTVSDGIVSQSTIISPSGSENQTGWAPLINLAETNIYVNQISGPIVALHNCFDKWQQPRKLSASVKNGLATFSLTYSFAPPMKTSNAAESNDTAFYVLGTLVGLFLVCMIVFATIKFIRRGGELKSEPRTMLMPEELEKPSSAMTIGKQNKAVLMKRPVKSESGQASLRDNVKVTQLADTPNVSIDSGPTREKPTSVPTSKAGAECRTGGLCPDVSSKTFSVEK